MVRVNIDGNWEAGSQPLSSVAEANSLRYSYAANGNMSKRGGDVITYNAFDLPVSISGTATTSRATAHSSQLLKIV